MIYGSPTSGDVFTDRRRTGIGGSDAAAILGVSPWKSALGVWEEKRGITSGSLDVTERMVWGTRLERAILAGYAEDQGIPIRRGGRRFLRHPEIPFVVGHPDAQASDRVVEAKAVAFLDERWGEPGSADVPLHYFCQLQHYMILTGKPLADLAALVGGRELRVFRVPADRSFQDALVAEERTFWKLVADGIAPAPDGSEDAGRALRKLFPRAFPEEIVATPAIAEIAARYEKAVREREGWEEIEAETKQLLMAYMGSRERLVGDGWSASWTNRKGATSWKTVAARYRELIERSIVAIRETAPHLSAFPPLDLDALEEEHRGEPSRTFTFTRKGEAG